MIPTNVISSQDRLFLFGYGLFETLLITESGPLFSDLHWNRMQEGASFLNLKFLDQSEWTKSIQEFIRHNPASFPFALRITLSGGSPGTDLPAQLFFNVRPLPYRPEQYLRGIKLHLLSAPRNEHSPLAAIKSTNYLENLLAKETALRFGADEGIWLNTKGYLTEGTMSNLFFIKKNKLFTPSLASGCLPGTRRHIIIKLAEILNIPTEEGLFTVEELLASDEIFVTNALMGLMPVCCVDDVSFTVSPPVAANSLLRRLELAYNKKMSGYP
ncbi:aminodeoxychorismate lyase [Desulfosporosinus acididurans]|uniref:Aminodeoxychorismate lyase n=1 Tax=Desulfosporosinus acididurans TaxID=476652 RepID=A0A0J1FX09_9FIRM|nr:aminotransferase class IV [Desulfosporosinus acididurans]KLU67924.1 aminodeoxychorismate lyase [Desulfosporosinus acididurans]